MLHFDPIEPARGEFHALRRHEAVRDDAELVSRRQALELSLYTFKYVDDVESVVVFMPPTPKGESNGTVFLRRSDVAGDSALVARSRPRRTRSARGARRPGGPPRRGSSGQARSRPRRVRP